MKRTTGKASRIARRAMALVMAAALCLSTLVITPPVKAAVKTKPALAVKKKTLYYNKAGKKTYTLKVKKNKVKKIKKTTWKTSKKSVVSISKKKKTSVKLTAKKKGKATITATIRYVPKGMWMVRTLKLKCKVTVKKAAGKTVKKTPAPQSAAKVELDEEEIIFNSTENGKNTETLTATAYDKTGKELNNPDIQWKSDDVKVAQVTAKGVVTAKGEGATKIRASVGTIQSAPCVVTVDSIAPSIEGAIVTNYKTITVYFDETVEGTPDVTVTSSENEEIEMDTELAEDGKSLTLTSDTALPAGRYSLQIKGLTDHAQNELQNGRMTVQKKASTPKEFVCKTKEVPQGQNEVTVYYAVLDQYQEEMPVGNISNLEVTAKTESGMPLDADPGPEGSIVISGAVGSLAVGKKIVISLSGKVEENGIKGEFQTVLVDGSEAGKAARIDKVTASSSMEMEGDDENPEYTLSTTEGNNEFTLTAGICDKFGMAVKEADVVYVINSSNGAVEFVNTEKPNSKTTNTAKSNEEVRVKALKGGTATISAYLVSDDSQRKDIKVTIHPTKLTKISVEKLPEDGCFNNRPTEAKITLEPFGTGITASDLRYEAEDESRIKDIDFRDEDGGICVSVTAKNDGLSDPITFTVYYEDARSGKVTSDLVVYHSSPLPTVDSIRIDPFKNAIPVGSEETTTYALLNRYGENLNDIVKGGVTVKQESGSSAQVMSLNAEKGILSVTGASAGSDEATIRLTYDGGISQSVKVKVTDSAYIQEMQFGEPEFAKESYGGLIKGDVNPVYIPLSAKDQYGNKYKLTMGKIQCLINGKDSSDPDNTLYDITFCKGDGKQTAYETAAGLDEVTAMKLIWRSPGSGTSIREDEIRLSVDSMIANHPLENKPVVSIALKPERQLNQMSFEKSSVSALEGSAVENKIQLIDQYGDPIDAAGSVSIRVTDEKGNEAGKPLTANQELDSAGKPITGKYTSSVTLPESGVYTVTASDTDTKTQASYTQTVGAAEQMIDRIEIDDVVKVNGASRNLSEVDCIKLSDDPDEATTLAFAYRVYDKSGNEIALDGSEIANGEMVWSVSSTDGAVADKQDNSDSIAAYMQSGKTTGSISIQLDYVMADKKVVRNIPVSSAESVAKAGTYKLVGTGSPSVGETTESVTDALQSVDDPVSYKIWAKDQYGDWFAVKKLYTAISKNNKAATVVVAKDADGEMMVTVTLKGDPGENGVDVDILVTQDEKLTVNVKKAPDIFIRTDIKSDFTSRATGFADKYYNKLSSQDEVPMDEEIGYFMIPFEEGQKTQYKDAAIKSVVLGGDTLSEDPVKISVGNNAFVTAPDYKLTEDGLKLSYIFIALHDTDPAGMMRFKVTFNNDVTTEAILEIEDLNKNFQCTGVQASAGQNATVEVEETKDSDALTECTLTLLKKGLGQWNHMVLFGFATGSDPLGDNTCYFTKKVVDGKVSYGFTKAEPGTKGALGYYPHQYNTGNVDTEYTVATADRHGVATITIHKKDESGQGAAAN